MGFRTWVTERSWWISVGNWTKSAPLKALTLNRAYVAARTADLRIFTFIYSRPIQLLIRAFILDHIRNVCMRPIRVCIFFLILYLDDLLIQATAWIWRDIQISKMFSNAAFEISINISYLPKVLCMEKHFKVLYTNFLFLKSSKFLVESFISKLFLFKWFLIEFSWKES